MLITFISVIRMVVTVELSYHSHHTRLKQLPWLHHSHSSHGSASLTPRTAQQLPQPKQTLGRVTDPISQSRWRIVLYLFISLVALADSYAVVGYASLASELPDYLLIAPVLLSGCRIFEVSLVLSDCVINALLVLS